jgi:hypothetical protein
VLAAGFAANAFRRPKWARGHNAEQIADGS